MGAEDQAGSSRDRQSRPGDHASTAACVGCLERLVGQKNYRSTGHLSARAAGPTARRTRCVCVSLWTLSRACRDLKITRKKKTLIAAEQDREDVQRKRQEWRQTQGEFSPEKVVFIDETWAKTNMTRTNGRAPMGTRVVEKIPAGRWQTTTFMGALRVTGFVAPLTIDGPLNGLMFLAWVEQHLAPTLSPGDCVVMDNLSSHKVAGVSSAIQARSARLVYLPPCSPI